MSLRVCAGADPSNNAKASCAEFQEHAKARDESALLVLTNAGPAMPGLLLALLPTAPVSAFFFGGGVIRVGSADALRARVDSARGSPGVEVRHLLGFVFVKIPEVRILLGVQMLRLPPETESPKKSEGLPSTPGLPVPWRQNDYLNNS